MRRFAGGGNLRERNRESSRFRILRGATTAGSSAIPGLNAMSWQFSAKKSRAQLPEVFCAVQQERVCDANAALQSRLSHKVAVAVL